MENTDLKFKRLVMDVEQKLHSEIKIRAAFHNISMKNYILLALAERFEKEKQYE